MVREEKAKASEAELRAFEAEFKTNQTEVRVRGKNFAATSSHTSTTAIIRLTTVRETTWSKFRVPFGP